MNIKQYKDVEQPFSLPNNLDLFSWSLPFLSDKIHEMMDHLLKKTAILSAEQVQASQVASTEEFSKIIDDMKAEKSEQDRARLNKIKAKVLTVARFNLMHKKHVENADIIHEAKKMYPNGKLPVGAILGGLEEQKSDLRVFIENQKKDKENEKFPLQAFIRRSSNKDLMGKK
jgi:serine/threonine-protein phosphatase 2B catalytic subunit